MQNSNKYAVLLTISLGTILSSYVSSSINIALPNIMSAFGFNMDSVVWVSLAYMIPYGSTLPIMGKFGDQFGRKKMYVLGLSIFTVATLLVGLAWNAAALILFRILQGIGAGLVLPNAMSLISEAFPSSERGQALGMWGALVAAGGALGPTIGGYIVQYLDWRLLFYSIVPLASLGLLGGIYILQESKNDSGSVYIDYLGGILLIVSLSTFLMALNQGSKEGWTSLYITGLFIASAFTMVAFVLVESYLDHPMVDLTLFKNVTFTMSNIVGFLSFLVFYGGLFLLPFFLRNVLGYTAIKAGLSLLPLSIVMVLLAPLGGKLADRAGARFPAALGMLIVTYGMYSFHVLSEMTAYRDVAVGLVILGVGLAFTMSPLSNGVMGSLPKSKIGVGSGIFNLFKNIGGSVGVALAGTLLNNRQIYHTNMLGEYINHSSYAAKQVMGAVQTAMIHNQGMTVGQAKVAAAVVTKQMIVQQATVKAFDDVFLIIAGLAVTGAVASLLIKSSVKDNASAENNAEQTIFAQNTKIEAKPV